MLDTVVSATGYRPAVTDFLPETAGLLDEQSVPLVSGGATAEKGLYFCGLRPAATGMLREIGIEARKIADLIARR